MARDALQSLLRLRRIALDDASRRVADCLARERQAEERLAAAELAIARETDVARLSLSDAEVEAFANWLPVGRRNQLAAEKDRNQAARETELARATLELARGAVRATETLIEQREAARRQVAERQAQAALDEIGLRSAPSKGDP